MRALLMMMGIVAASAQAADIAVLASPAIKEAYAEIVPLFEKQTKRRVATTWNGTADIMKRMTAGEVYDAVIVASNSLEELTDTGRMMAGSRSDIARSGVGVAVRAGAPKPDVGSPEALKRTLLTAKTIGISTGPSGAYLIDLFQRLGVLNELRPKFRQPPSGGAVGELVAKGEADIGFQQVSELVHLRGIDFLGPLPQGLQRITVFSGGVHARAREPDAARAFLRFLASAQHAPILEKHGLQLGVPSPY